MIKMRLLIDTGVLGRLCHPKKAHNQPVVQWLTNLLSKGDESVAVYVPEICDYELRRKLLHLVETGQATQKSIDRLDDLGRMLDYLPIDTDMMRKAAELWAEARKRGVPTAADVALDGDVILAAQALLIRGTVVTSNRRHLSRFVTAKDWPEITL